MKRRIIIGATVIIVITVILTILFKTDSSKKEEDITINKAQVSLFVDEKVTLKIEGTTKEVSWKSKDKSIATVDKNGTVVSKKEGITTIVGTVKKEEYTCKIIVTEPYLNSNKLTLAVEQTFQLEMTGAKIKEWNVEDNTIAMVDDKGCITAIKDGSTKILCITENGKTYKCELTVDSSHTHNYVDTTTKESTCLEYGVMTYTCECGSQYTENIEKVEHSYKLVKTVDATCEKTGNKEYTCEKCKNSYTEKIDKKKHDYKLDKTVKSTCEKAGYKEYKCNNCGKTYEKNLEKLKHDYKLVKTVNATETSDGYKEYKCSNCNDSYKETIAKTTHTHNYKLVKTVNATCDKAGYKEYKCDKCSSSYKDDISKLEHSYQLIKTEESTCKKTGYKEYKCNNCGSSYKENLALNPNKHNYTSTSDLMYIYYKCKDCGNSNKEYNDIEYTIDLGNGKTTTVVGHYDLDMANRIGELVNEKRVSVGRHALKIASIDDNLSIAARIRAVEIFEKYSHTRPNGQSIESLISYDVMGENISFGKESGDDFFNSWCNSPEHAMAQMSWSYAKIGISVFAIKLDDGKYIHGAVELFN